MLVSLTVRRRTIEVMIETDDPYNPDVLDDMTSRARDLFRLALTDQHHLGTEHEVE